jgi:filamentous hemagglutinin family protein
MKIASKTRLSLRKLFTAMLAVGPLAVLPSPVWAVLPTASSYTVTNGTVTLQSSSANTVNINFTDKAILTWGTTAGTVAAPNRGVTDSTTITNFIVDTGDTWNFASTGAILNKVSKGTNATATVAATGANPAVSVAGAAAIINGQLLGSSAKVYILGNGGIVLGGGAQVNTQSLVLSTIAEQSDGTFITQGDLYYSGASQGDITIGSGAPGATAVSVGGSLSATAGAITTAGSMSVGGDLVLKTVTAANTINFAGTTTVNGNLTATTNNGKIVQAGGSTLTVGAATTGTQTATLNSGTEEVKLDALTNNFERVVANTSGAAGNVTLKDANIVTLGASTIGGKLDVAVGGMTGTAAVTTDGAVVVGGDANFVSTTAAGSGVTIGNNSSVAGTVTAQTAGGAVSVTTTGNLTLGAIKTDNTASVFGSAPATAHPGLGATVATDAVAKTVSGITLNAGTTSPIYTGNVSITVASPIPAATAQLKVDSISIADGGSGYTGNFAVGFPAAPAGGTTAAATATVVGGVVTGITITNPGAGYTSFPTPTIPAAPAGGTNAKGSALASLSGIKIDNVGSGIDNTSTISVVGGGGSGATVTPTLAGDTLTAGVLGAAGSGYTSVPAIVVTHPTANAVPAQATATRDTTTGMITAVSITNAGVGYGATPPTIIFQTTTQANSFTGGAITGNTTGNITNTGALTSGQGITLRGAVVTTGAAMNTGANATASFQSNAGAITFGGGTVTANRVSVNATGGDVVLAAGGDIKTSGRAQDASTFTATGNINLDNIAGAAKALDLANGQQINITAPNASIRSVQNITLGTANVTGNLSLRAGTVNAGNGGNKNITLGRETGSSATTARIGGNLTLTTDGTGTISQNADSLFEVFGAINARTGYNNQDAVPANALLKGGDINLNAAAIPGALTPSVRMGAVSASTGLAGGNVTIAESTTLNLGNITANVLTATSTAGSIIDTGALAVTTANFTVSGANNVVLDTATNTIGTLSLNGGVDNSVTALNAAVTLASTAGSTGTTTIGTNNTFAVTLGNVVTTGNLVVNSGSYIDIAGNANISGNLTLNATGNVANASTFSSVYAGNVTQNSTQSNAINSTGRVSVINAVNLPLLSFATAPTVTVVGGAEPGTAVGATSTIKNGIVDSITAGVGSAGYTIAPTVTLSAPPSGGVQATATATVTGGAITGFTITNAGAGYAAAPIVTLVGGGDPTTVATATANLGPTGQIASFTVTNNATNGGADPYVSSKPLRIDIAGATNTSVLQSAGTLKVGGTTTIASSGNALLFRNNDFTNVVLNSTTGGALINDVNSVVVSGVSGGNVDIRSGSNGGGSVVDSAVQPFTEANPWAVTLGQLNVGSLNVTAGNGTAGNSGAITQTANTTIHSFGPAYFTTTNNAITLGNAGNNFGRVGLTSGGGNVTFVEAGTIKLGNLSTGNATVSLTSSTGGIIEDPTVDVLYAGSGGGTLRLTANNGSIILGNDSHTAGTTQGTGLGTVVATAPTGAVKLVATTGNITLGAIDANSLTVTSTAGRITQSAAAKVFGSTTFSAGTDITVTNNANNFGRIFITTTGVASNVAVTEMGTMNLGRVTMAASATGNFTATSVAGDIIDTGLGGVRPAGINGTAGTGIVTLAAAAGNITLDDPTTDFPTTGGVVFNAANVTLSPLGGSALYLGASGQTAVATGNLTVTSATGSVFNAGPVNVTGDAFFQSGNGDILMTNSSNNFGTVKFAGKIVSITEAGHLSLVTGSSATGAATFTTAGGNIDIVNKGGTVSLASTAWFTASGSITLPKLIQVSDTLSVSAAGTKDLSKLSKSGDLGGKDPRDFGTGSYVKPMD